MAECIQVGAGPAGIILQSPDHIITVGALAAAEVYPHRPCPVIVAEDDYERLADALPTVIHPDGAITQQSVAE